MPSYHIRSKGQFQFENKSTNQAQVSGDARVAKNLPTQNLMHICYNGSLSKEPLLAVARYPAAKSHNYIVVSLIVTVQYNYMK